MAQLPQASKPQPNIYTLLVGVAAVALLVTVIVVFMDLKDAYGIKAGDMLKPLSEITASTK